MKFVFSKYTSTATSDVADIDVCILTFGNPKDRYFCINPQNAFVVPATVYGKIKIKNPSTDPQLSIHVSIATCYY